MMTAGPIASSRSLWVVGALVLLLSPVLAAGCGSPAEEAGGGETMTEGAGTGSPAAAGDRPIADSQTLPFVREGGGEGEISWTVPESWISVPPANSMRKAQYTVPAEAGDPSDGECVVFYFGPGQGGPPMANAERWASQFQDGSGNPPEPVVEETTMNGRSVMKVFIEGTYAPSGMMGGTPAPPVEDAKLLGAIVEGPDANWFFKCTGPEATMEANREGFDAMIASIR